MKHKNSRKLYNYWQDIKGLNTMPDRAQFEPGSVGPILSDMFILNVGDGIEANYRLAGTRLCALYNLELKNTPFALPWLGNDRAACDDMVSTLGLEKNPIVIGSLATSRSDQTIHLETLILPVLHCGEPNKRVMGLTVPLQRPLWLGNDPIVNQSINSIRVLRPEESNVFFSEHPIELPASRAANAVHLAISGETGNNAGFTPSIVGPEQNALRPLQPQSSSPHQSPRRVKHLTVLDGGIKT